jgi:hypothetical protein
MKLPARWFVNILEGNGLLKGFQGAELPEFIFGNMP